MSARQRERHRKHANPFSMRYPVPPLDLAAVYGRAAPLAIDVGFGEGAFLLELAALHPEWNVLGLEIREHLVRDALTAARARGLGNVHAVLANANMHLAMLIPDRSVAFVAVNFPDPWFKKRHQKRRVLRPDWLDVLEPKLVPGAELHAMSDYEPIARQMLKVMDASPRWENLAGVGQLAAASTTRVMTEREVKHLGRAQPIYRMHFRYGNPPMMSASVESL